MRSPGRRSSIGTSSRPATPCRAAWRGWRASSAVISRCGAGAGEILEEGAAGDHQRDHRAGQGFVQQQRAEHRQRRQEVEAHIAVAEAAQDVPEQDAEDGQRAEEEGGLHARKAQRQAEDGERQGRAALRRAGHPGGSSRRVAASRSLAGSGTLRVCSARAT